MMDDLAEAAAEEFDATEAELLDRWEGAPENIAQDLFQVRDMESGDLVDLDLFYPYQPKLLHAYFYGDESIINVYKGRRIGVSFIFCVAILIDALRSEDRFFAVVSRTKAQSQSRISDIEQLIKYSKILDVEDLKKNNKGEIVLPNDATIKAFTGDPDGARGFDSAKCVFVDEMAFLEDQEATMQAFMPFISLGDAQMLQVSTPKVSNDLFLETHERGSEQGRDGVISIQQPTFRNPDDIDITQPLTAQNVEPVRPDLNVETVDTERAQDPQGFAQEYLCRPISDEYRFFTSAGINRAQERAEADDYVYSPATHARHEDGMMVMGVDIGIDSDDSAIAVFEHANGHRYLRFHSIVDRGDLNAAGVGGDPKNPSDLADYIEAVTHNMGVDYVFLDKTGPGRGFQSEVEKRLGRRAHGFNFSDKDEVQRMMGDFNYGLHNDLVTLHPDSAIDGQLEAIVKEQRHESSKPRFSGKKHAPDGKDDLAMALVLGAYPPNFDADRSHSAHQKDEAWGDGHQPEDGAEDDGGFRGAKTVAQKNPENEQEPSKVVAERSRRNFASKQRNYDSRHTRRRSGRTQY